MIYDVSVLLCVITWPSGKLRVYVDAFKAFVHQALRRANVILVFDRYFPNSIKTFIRTQRSGLSRVYKLTPWHRQGNGCQSCQEGVFPTPLHW